MRNLKNRLPGARRRSRALFRMSRSREPVKGARSQTLHWLKHVVLKDLQNILNRLLKI